MVIKIRVGIFSRRACQNNYIDRSSVKVNNETLFRTETACQKLKPGETVFTSG